MQNQHRNRNRSVSVLRANARFRYFSLGFSGSSLGTETETEYVVLAGLEPNILGSAKVWNQLLDSRTSVLDFYIVCDCSFQIEFEKVFLLMSVRVAICWDWYRTIVKYYQLVFEYVQTVSHRMLTARPNDWLLENNDNRIDVYVYVYIYINMYTYLYMYQHFRISTSVWSGPTNPLTQHEHVHYISLAWDCIFTFRRSPPDNRWFVLRIARTKRRSPPSASVVVIVHTNI